jgi:hypothetical protein
MDEHACQGAGLHSRLIGLPSQGRVIGFVEAHGNSCRRVAIDDRLRRKTMRNASMYCI